MGSGILCTKHYDYWSIYSTIKTIRCLIFLLSSKDLSHLEYNFENFVENSGGCG